MEELSFNAIIGCLAGFVIGVLVGFSVIVSSIDNDSEEKDCVDFYKKNNYITETCKPYEDKLKNIKSK